jgi:hypothetical protein
VNRRNFVIRTAAVLSTGAVAGAVPFPLLSAETVPAQTSPALSGWDAVRAQFNLTPNKINMSCYWQTSHPKVVRDAIEQHRRGLGEGSTSARPSTSRRMRLAWKSPFAPPPRNISPPNPTISP